MSNTVTREELSVYVGPITRQQWKFLIDSNSSKLRFMNNLSAVRFKLYSLDQYLSRKKANDSS